MTNEKIQAVAQAVAMLEAGYTYADTARRLGVTHSQVQRYESSAKTALRRMRRAADEGNALVVAIERHSAAIAAEQGG